MLNVLQGEAPKSKLYISQGQLPKKINAGQPPSKKQPFSTILKQPFTHSAQVIIPEELYEIVWENVASRLQPLEYSRVIIPLSALLEGDFFNGYIKSGNIMMLSQGRAGIDSLYSLKDGLLRLELPKEIYEKAGLVGEPIRDAGRKHIETRFAIELDLRKSSMVHGKKGFERIVWAFKNVLNSAVTWLFYDFDAKKDNSPNNTQQPEPWSLGELEKHALELDEWLTLASLQSPRVHHDDQIDPYLCRYSKPDGDPTNAAKLVVLRWSGFIAAEWLRHLFVILIEQSLQHRRVSSQWFALSCQAFQTQVVDCHDGYTILGLANGEATDESPIDSSLDGAKKSQHRDGSSFILWEYASA